MKDAKIFLILALCSAACSKKEPEKVPDTTRVAVTPTTPTIDPTLWLTTGADHVARIDSTTSRAKLVELFGAPNVVDDSLQFADAPAVAGTIVFPNDSSRRFEVVWADDKLKDKPERVDLHGESGRWAVDPGIRLGMSLKDLERINGGPFTVMGFDWDYGGGVTNWRGGKLKSLTSGRPHISIQLSPAETDTGSVRNSVAGDREFSSTDKSMQELNPHVAGISVTYNLPRK